jgi:hypothetical protein
MIRFTIRDVLLGMVIVGLALGWAVDRWRLASDYRRLDDAYGRQTWNYTWCIIELEQLGYTANFRDERIRGFSSAAPTAAKQPAIGKGP